MSYAEVSVIIPCYRCAKSAARAVESVNAQTLKPAEVILVDDCSGDGTINDLKTIQHTYGTNWVKIISLTENSGPGSARNKGWDAAKQPYIAFLDADEVWDPKKVELQFSWMQNNPAAVMSGHRRRELAVDSDIPPGDFDSYSGFRQVAPRELLTSNRFATSSVMSKRNIRYRFASGMRYSEDFLLWCQICLDGNECFWTPSEMCYLFKARFGEAGLSNNLWLMEKGELSVYTTLYKTKKIGICSLFFYHTWSLLRHMRRLSIARLFGPATN